MIITLGIIAGLLLFGMGLILGLYLGEKGRRKDIQWYTSLAPAPADYGTKAEIELPEDVESTARERAEIIAIEAGLRNAAQAEGHRFTEEELHEEAMRLVTQMNSELDS